MITAMSGDIYVIGVDLGGTNVRAAAVRPDGGITARARLKSNPAEGYEYVVGRVADVIKTVVDEARTAPLRVGLGSAGAIDFSKGIVTRSPNFPDWKNAPLGRDVAERVGVPVILENDANAAAIGEGWTGAASEWDNFAMLTLGTGVGGGIVLDGRIWRGPTGMAGEIGHLPVRSGGRICGCGASGCLEAYASASGVVRSARERFKESAASWLRERSGEDKNAITATAIKEGAEVGDKLCIDLLKEAGDYLGIALGAVALTLDLADFVIGGGLAGALDFMSPSMRDAAMRTAYTLNEDKLRTSLARLGDDAGIIGAAKLALEA